jgi:large subunit ribosomal protein L16
MNKNIPSVIKRRPFKIWSRNKRYNINFSKTFNSIPTQLNPSFSLDFSSNLSPILRYRRIVVKSTTYGYVSSTSIEAFRKAVTPYFRKKETKVYKFFIRCYSFLPLTKKPSEVRMGGGKGSKLRGFYSPVKPGQILFEIFSRDPNSTKSLLSYASRKLSVSTKIFFL